MNQRDRVRTMLEQAAAGVTTSDFLDAHLPRFSARVKELRDQGLVIERDRLSASAFRYTLTSTPKLHPVTKPLGEDGVECSAPLTKGHRAGGREQHPRQAAASSGTGTLPARRGGDGTSSAVTVLPTLFELEPAGHYGGDAA